MGSKDLPKGGNSLAGITAAQRLYLTILQALLLMTAITALALYAGRINDGERDLLVQQTQYAQGFVQDMELENAPTAEIREALTANLHDMQQILRHQDKRSSVFAQTLMTVSIAGVLIVISMSYLIIKGITKKYPELNEER